MTDLYAHRRETIMSAYEAGVSLYAGTDGGGARRHGNLPNEIRAMAALGMPAEYALGAASWRARAWLGFDGLVEGASADLVVYDADPLADLSVLDRPVAIVLRGRVVA
jgi:imidazolonepropionase-like amidohydrolase